VFFNNTFFKELLKDTSPVSVFAFHCAAWLYWFFDARRLYVIKDGHAKDCVPVWVFALISSCSPLNIRLLMYGFIGLLIKRIYQGRVHPTGSQSIESPLLTSANSGSGE
jgi:hypothetical protein